MSFAGRSLIAIALSDFSVEQVRGTNGVSFFDNDDRRLESNNLTSQIDEQVNDAQRI